MENLLVSYSPVLENILFWLNGRAGAYHSLALRATCRSLHKRIPGLASNDKKGDANDVLSFAVQIGDVMLANMALARGASLCHLAREWRAADIDQIIPAIDWAKWGNANIPLLFI